MTLLDNFPHEATARRRIRTLDSLGGSSDSFVTLFTERACWRQAASQEDIIEFEKRGMSAKEKIYFRTDPSLDERDILIISGVTLEVRTKAVPDATVGMGIAWRVMAEVTTTGSTP